MIWGVATVLFAIVAIMAIRLIAAIYNDRRDDELSTRKEIQDVEGELDEAVKAHPNDVAMHFLIALRGNRLRKRK